MDQIRSITRLTPLAALAALCVLTSCAKPEAVVKADPPPVVIPVAPVVRVDISSSSAVTAEFTPFQEVEVMAKVAGYVRAINVDLGDHVKAGQVLAVLEIPEMQDELTRAAATIAQNNAEISAARDELARSESVQQMAHLSHNRLQEVAKREAGLIPLQEIDEAKSRDLVAQAQVAAAKSKLTAAQQRTQVAKAEEARARTMQNYVNITAPFSGIVTRRYANAGAMVQAGTASQSQAMPLVRVSQNSTLRLSLPVPESMAPTVRVGRPVDVKVTSLGQTFQGKVARFSGKLDMATRTMVTEVDVPNPKGVILPGMYAEVTLRLAQKKQVVAAPLEAIDRSNSGTRAFKVDATGTVKIVTVQLGIEDARFAEILGGLDEGDQVIIGQRAGLKDGEKVRAKLTELNGSKK